MEIVDQLFALQDTAYADFQSKLMPTVPRKSMIGVRVPQLRKLSARLANTPQAQAFLHSLPHRWYDENMLHALLLSTMGDTAQCLQAVDAFLPYVDNWAVCDIMSPKVFRSHKSELWAFIEPWLASSHTYTRRFALDMLMTHYLNDAFTPSVLEKAASACTGDYYVDMACAWLLATALCKQWDATLPYLTEHRLSPWVHHKTIQKARESRRISTEQKALLSVLKGE